MVTGQTQNLWKLKDLGGIVTKENVVREGPGRYGSEVYHGTSQVLQVRCDKFAVFFSREMCILNFRSPGVTKDLREVNQNGLARQIQLYMRS
jgi:hypothetical protein